VLQEQQIKDIKVVMVGQQVLNGLVLVVVEQGLLVLM